MTQAVREKTLAVDITYIYAAVSEITVQRCMMGPFMSSLCYPHTTMEEDSTKGKWVRVGKDLNRQSGLWHLVR